MSATAAAQNSVEPDSDSNLPPKAAVMSGCLFHSDFAALDLRIRHIDFSGQERPQNGKFGRLALRGNLLLQYGHPLIDPSERLLAVKHVIGPFALDLLHFHPRLRLGSVEADDLAAATLLSAFFALLIIHMTTKRVEHEGAHLAEFRIR